MRLRIKSRAKLVFALILIIALPVFVWAVLTQRVEFRKKASSGEPSACSPLANNIYVSPEGTGGTCHDIQTAINAVSGPNFTINIETGSYTIPESGTPFSLNISNKTNLTITGNASSGTGAVQLHFKGNSGGILIENSSNVYIQWMTITGSTSNGMISSRGSSSTNLGYLVLNDQGAHTFDFSNGSTGSLFNSDITSVAHAGDINNMQGINISNNVIHNAHGGVSVDNSNGSILANLFNNNTGPSLLFNQANNFHIQSNTIVYNSTSGSNNEGAIMVVNPPPSQTNLIFEKNIVAANSGAGVNINNGEIVTNVTTTFNQNDFYNNKSGNYIGVPDQTGSNGNISADPLFGSLYCLNPGSPAILPARDYNTYYLGYRGLCGPLPTITISPNSCTNQTNGTSCSTAVCPPCYYSTPKCLAPCQVVTGTCQNQTCLPPPTPTPNICQGQADGTSCQTTVCPACVNSVPRCLAPCRVISGSCQNQTCLPTPTPTCTPLPPTCINNNLNCPELRLPYVPPGGWCPPGPSPTQNYCEGKVDGTVCNAGFCPPPPTCSPGQACPLTSAACQFIPGSCQNQTCIAIPEEPPTWTPMPTSQLHSVRVLYPNGGENITYGSTVRIRYQTSPEIANVLISYQLTNSPNYIYITHTPVPNTGYYDWNVSLDPGFNLPYQTRIRIEAAPPLYQVYGVSAANFTVVNGGPFNFDFRVKFAGVSDGSADGATATIRFVGTNGVNMITPPVIFHHIGGGIYQALVTIPNTLMVPGPGYEIIVKGEKHVARKFCMQVGQTGPCPPGTYVNIPITTIPLLFDFTGLPLQPGDLPPQDGVVDVSDLTAITNLLSKPCSALTAQDKYIGDLNYDGCIDMKDIFLFRQTLQTRYDEN